MVYLFPEGHFELILQSDRDILFQSSHTKGWAVRPQQFIGGLHQSAFILKPTNQQTRLLSIQFKPVCSRYFIPDPLYLFKNQVVDLREVFSTSTLDQLKQIDLSVSVEQFLPKLEAFLLSVFQKRNYSPIETSVALLHQNGGFTRIEQLAEQACLSAAQFRKRFREEVGLSPKEYSKVVRINTVIRRLNNNPEPVRFTDLAYQSGYFDQSHFIKDFQSVMGTTPRQFLFGKLTDPALEA